MDTDQKSTNVTWHTSHIAREDRERANGHKAAVLWFTGLSGSGKSTVACAVEKLLFANGCRTYILDGDNVRQGLNKNLTFAPEDRVENIRRIGEVANLMTQAGIITLTAFISPYRADRDRVRALLPEGRFIEVFVDCPIDICESRDPKGLYQKARNGEIKDFTGVNAPYEAPLNPEVTVDTAEQDIEECAKKIFEALQERGIVS